MTQTPIFKEHYVNNGPNMSIHITVNGIILFRVMAKWKITLTANELNLNLYNVISMISIVFIQNLL